MEMSTSVNTLQTENGIVLKTAIENLRLKIDYDLKTLYEHSTFRAKSVAMPPSDIFDGAYICFRGYLAWMDIPQEDKNIIMDDFIPYTVEEAGFKCYWVPQPKGTWVRNEVLRVYMD
jgi:hypothetical protein